MISIKTRSEAVELSVQQLVKLLKPLKRFYNSCMQTKLSYELKTTLQL